MRSGADVQRGTLGDGVSLAILVVAIFCAEAFDRARLIVVGLREQGVDSDPAAPDWLAEAWVVVALAGLVAALYVARRFVEVARAIDAEPPPPARRRLMRALQDLRRWLCARVTWFAYAAVAVWVAFQVLAIAEVAGRELVDGAATAVHWAALAATVLALVAGGSVPGVAAAGARRASAVRVQLVFLVVLYLLVFFVPMTSGQLVDVLRGWGDGSLSRPVAGLAGALLLGAVCRASAARLLVPETTPVAGLAPDALRRAAARLPRIPAGRPGRREVIGAALAGAAAAWAVPGFNALAVLGLGIAILVWVTVPVGAADLERGRERERVALRRLAGTIGVLPVGILVVGLVVAATDSLLLPSGLSGSDVRLLVCAAVAAAAFGALSARAHNAGGEAPGAAERRWPGEAFGVAGFVLGLAMWPAPDVAAWGLLVFAAALAAKVFGERGARELWGGWGVTLGLGVAVYLDTIEVTRAVGAFGLAFVGFTGVLALLHVAASVGTRRRLRCRCFGRTWAAPVVALLLAWLAAAALTLPDEAHRARTVPRGTAEPVALERAVSDWLDDQQPNGGGYVPMLFVGASGGGSKAAYWTTLVLDCVFGDGAPVEDGEHDECGGGDSAGERFGRLFLTSSASGGSVGIHHLVNHRDEVGRDEPWITPTAGREVLSPVVGWGLFHDLPAALLGLPTDPARCDRRLACPLNADRALVQEAAIGVFGDGTEARIDEALLARPGPVTVFNAVVTDRAWWPTERRLLLSRVDLAPPAGCPDGDAAPDAVDAHDLVPGRDVPLVTAAMLSARFPLLEPAARLGYEDCGRPRAIGDGGLYENTGLLTIAELLPRVRRAVETWRQAEPGRADVDVRPIVLSIDDDVYRVVGDSEYGSGARNARGRRSVRVRRQLQRCRFWPRAAYRRISPSVHVGASAATGWEISETSRREDLVETLRRAAGKPSDAIQEIRDMLDGARRPDCDARTRG